MAENSEETRPKENSEEQPKDTSLGQLLIQKAREYIVGVVVTAVGAGILAGWLSFKLTLESAAQNFAVAAVAADLNKRESTLGPAITGFLTRLRANEIGELTTGQFTLTPSNPVSYVAVYFPDGAEGILTVKLNGDVSSRNYVLVGQAKGDLSKIDDRTTNYNLTNWFAPTKPKDPQSMVVMHPRQLDALHILTFQLDGADVKKPNPETPISVDVTYLALVRPTLKLEKAE